MLKIRHEFIVLIWQCENKSYIEDNHDFGKRSHTLERNKNNQFTNDHNETTWKEFKLITWFDVENGTISTKNLSNKQLSGNEEGTKKLG